ELVVHLVIAQHVAHVLAEEALDALAELLHPIDVALCHAPGAVGRVRWPRLEWRDLRLHAEVPRHVGDQVADARERAHGLDRHRLLERQGVQRGHARGPGPAVDLCRARATLAGLAVPAAREVGRLLGLYAVDRVEDDHALGDLGPIVLQGAAARVAAPDSEGRRRHSCWFPSTGFP